MAACASLYGYAPSIGLNDCLLALEDRRVLRTRTEQRVRTMTTGARTPDDSMGAVPYSMEDDALLMDGTVPNIQRLIAVSTATHQTVRDIMLRRRRVHTSPVSTSASSACLNQAVLLCMLGTKGSLSNLAQCSHSLGLPGCRPTTVAVNNDNRHPTGHPG